MLVEYALRLVDEGRSAAQIAAAVEEMCIRDRLKPKQKLAGQVLAALIACIGGLKIGVIINPFAPGEIMLGWLAYPITVIYLVAFTNIINLIDGLDGLATGICGIASFTMFTMAMLSGRIDAAALSIALFGSCVAFLHYNFNPASIFLGDSGSLLLGFALGSISLLNVSRTAALTSLIIPLILAGVPIIDTFLSLIHIYRSDRTHRAHRPRQTLHRPGEYPPRARTSHG